jgi:GTPase SAR1 family protein
VKNRNQSKQKTRQDKAQSRIIQRMALVIQNEEKEDIKLDMDEKKSDESADQIITIVLVGVSGTGKTRLIKSWLTGGIVCQAFDSKFVSGNPKSPLKTNFHTFLALNKMYELCRLHVWDTSGLDTKPGQLNVYYKLADVLLVTISEDCIDAVNYAIQCTDQARAIRFKCGKPDLSIAWIINKADLLLPRQLDLTPFVKHVRSQAMQRHTHVIAASGVTQYNVDSIINWCFDSKSQKLPVYQQFSSTLLPSCPSVPSMEFLDVLPQRQHKKSGRRSPSSEFTAEPSLPRTAVTPLPIHTEEKDENLRDTQEEKQNVVDVQQQRPVTWHDVLNDEPRIPDFCCCGCLTQKLQQIGNKIKSWWHSINWLQLI